MSSPAPPTITSHRPTVVRIEQNMQPSAVFQRLSHLPHTVFFDSALKHPTLGRYSFIAADPFRWLEFSPKQPQALTELEQQLSQFPTTNLPGLPPFQGGAAGLFGYELSQTLEQIPSASRDEFEVPALAVGLYDLVVAFDHGTNEAWIISQGFPELDPAARNERSEARIRQFQQLLREPPTPSPAQHENSQSEQLPRLLKTEMAPQHLVSSRLDITSDFTADDYRAAVQVAVEYIHAGDIFQVNLSQRLLHPALTDASELYLRLRARNAAPFAAYFDTGKFKICSASPERFLSIRDRQVETRPIKGTRRRGISPEADLFAGDELRLSEKDRAENVMIVDLLRNDLSRICEPDSVRVANLCGLETYAYVQHLVSTVEGKLTAGTTLTDPIRAAFPGGSITGAPKVRAMEIIAELEPTARGAYCGALGYIGFDGSTDSSILIRTITAGCGWWQLPVGGGIVAASDPHSEYEETWHKAEGLLRALLP